MRLVRPRGMLTLALALAGPVASAEEPELPPGMSSSEHRDAVFGALGQWVITGASDIGISWSSWSSGASLLSATFSPGVDYFFIRNVSAGIDVDVSRTDGRGFGADGSLVETTSTTFSGGPRMGVNVPIGSWVSWYPRATVGFESVHREQKLVAGSSLSVPASPLGYPSTTQAGPWISVYAPLLLHVAPHFFVGAGPDFFHDFGNAQGGPNIGGQRTTVGAYFVVGGTWGGRPEPFEPGEPIAPATETPRRFGDAREIILDSEILAETFWTTYAGSGSSSFRASVEPGLDYFVTDDVSLGIAASVSHSTFTGIDPSNGATVTSKQSGWGVEPRVGFVVPCARWLSWYTRLGLVFGGGDYDETSGTQENKYTTSRVAIHAYAPLLVHLARHFFTGFGPSISLDLSDSFTYASGLSAQNGNSTVGLGLVVGGWL